MKKVVITVDSAADLPKNIAEEYGIEIMPMHVVINDKEKNDGFDIFDIDENIDVEIKITITANNNSKTVTYSNTIKDLFGLK